MYDKSLEREAESNMKKKCGIVFVHGIVGNNRIFDFLMPMVPEGWMVKTVTLAGHGSDALAFSSASMDEWKRQVNRAVAEVGTRCEKVVGVGHSMGCLLLLEASLQEDIASLFLLNPPLRIRLRGRLFVNSFKVAMGRTETDTLANAAREAYGIEIDANPLHYLGWPRRYMELFAQVRRVRRLLKGGAINCPIVAIVSELDEMVSPATARILEEVPNAQVVKLSASHHYHYPPADRSATEEAFLSFLSSLYSP